MRINVFAWCIGEMHNVLGSTLSNFLSTVFSFVRCALVFVPFESSENRAVFSLKRGAARLLTWRIESGCRALWAFGSGGAQHLLIIFKARAGDSHDHFLSTTPISIRSCSTPPPVRIAAASFSSSTHRGRNSCASAGGNCTTRQKKAFRSISNTLANFHHAGCSQTISAARALDALMPTWDKNISSAIFGNQSRFQREILKYFFDGLQCWQHQA
jgi:hypothetical protein